MRLSGGTLSLWLNGVNVASGGSGPIEDLTFPVLLCNTVDLTHGLPDRITDVFYWNSALSDASLETLGKSRVHLLSQTPPTAAWPLDTCPEGASGHTVSFPDRSGNNRPLTGNDGGTGTGLICRGSTYVSRPWGVH